MILARIKYAEKLNLWTLFKAWKFVGPLNSRCPANQCILARIQYAEKLNSWTKCSRHGNL
jgi:hypothetical protein